MDVECRFDDSLQGQRIPHLQLPLSCPWLRSQIDSVSCILSFYFPFKDQS